MTNEKRDEPANETSDTGEAGATRSPEPQGHEPAPHFEEGEEAPPPGMRAMAIARWVLLVVISLAAIGSVLSTVVPLFGQPTPQAQTPRYHCPMHPQIVSDQPGECPICHMQLEPFAGPAAEDGEPPATVGGAGTSSSAAPSRATTEPAGKPPAATGYTCPMHRQVHSDTPGRCPICGMDLVPEASLAAPIEPPAPAPRTGATAPPDTTPIRLELDRIQKIGMRTALVERRANDGALRVTAAVEVPEQARAEVHVRAAGFVEAIAVRDVGEKVKAGQNLASVYSPEIYQAEQELLAIAAWPEGSGAAPPLDAARRKLDLLGVSNGAIDGVLARKKAFRSLGVGSPIGGYVIRKNVVLGAYVTPDKALFEIADLSRVYVIASVYPADLASVHVGDVASFATTSLPGKRFETKVEQVYPDVDPVTRTARVRLSLATSDLALRPGLFGVVELAGAESTRLTVPIDAVIDTGKAVYVFVAEEGGRFTPRSVELGDEMDGAFVIRGGVAEGERVVSGATFLIDAESRLQASFTRQAAPPMAMGEMAPGDAR